MRVSPHRTPCLVVALSCAAALAGMAVPAYASEPVEHLSYGQHKPAIDSLHIYFREAIDTASIDLGRMDLVVCSEDDGCTDVPLAGQQISRARDDGRVIEVRLPHGALAALPPAANATLVFGDGAYLNAGGHPSSPERAPVLIGPTTALPQLLWRVEYRDHLNELVLHFHEAVDPASIDEDLLRVTVEPASEEDALFTLSGLEPVRVADGGLVVAYELRPDDRNGLLAVLPSYSQDWWQSYERWLEGSDTIPAGTPFLTVWKEAYERASDGMPTHYDYEVIAVIGHRGAPLPPVGFLRTAVYDADTGMLALTLREPVDPSSVDMGLIRLVGHGDGLNAALDDIFDRVDSGPSQIIAAQKPGGDELPASGLSVRLDPGAYRSLAEGAPNRAEETPVTRGEVRVALLERAEYVADSDEIVLYFAGEVDPIYEGEASCENDDCTVMIEPRQHIQVRDGCCAGLGVDVIRAGGDQRSIIYEIVDYRYNLLAVTDLWVRLYPESYTAISAGTVNGREEVPLEVVSQGEVVAPVRPDNLLAHARYDADGNRLALHFYEKIDPYHLHAGRMSIHDHSDSVRLSASEFASMGTDQKSIVFELSDRNRYGLSLMTGPVLRLEPGAVRSSAAGVEGGGDVMPLDVQGDLLHTLNPDVSADLLLGRAQYNMYEDDAEVVLIFGEAIDPHSVRPSRIAMVNDNCGGVVLSDQDSIRVSEDGKSAVIRVDHETSDILKKTPDMRMRLDRGAFATEAGGTANAAGDVPLVFLGKRTWHGLHVLVSPDVIRGMPCHLTYGVDPLSSILNVSKYGQAYIDRNTKTVMSAVHDALDEWSALNPLITFEQVTDEQPDITIEWMWLRGFRLGEAGPTPDGGVIRVAVRVPDQLGNWNVVGYDLMRYVVSHEFGHLLGLGHHVSEDHLMHGSDEFVQDPYDTLGYNIPPRWEYPPTGIFRCISGC